MNRVLAAFVFVAAVSGCHKPAVPAVSSPGVSACGDPCAAMVCPPGTQCSWNNSCQARCDPQPLPNFGR